MTVRQLLPREDTVEMEALLASLADPEGRLEPFAAPILDFCAAFSRALFQHPEARRLPALQALAFRMRKAELARLEERFRLLESPEVVLAPRGLVFHVPPANVDTLFVYSWLMSVLSGNRNIIRMSSSASGQALLICRVFAETLADHGPALAGNTAIVQYGHDAEINAAISAAADVRVVWGGDETVAALRRFPLAPHAKELTFPDRYSMAVFRAEPFLGLDETARAALAAKFYNDTFWFDQLACSSPRVIFWCGAADAADNAAAIFYGLVAEEASRKSYAVDAAAHMSKFTFACRSILDGESDAYRQFSPALTVLGLSEIPRLTRRHSGGGLLFQCHIEALDALVPVALRRDQTLVHFGFEASELRALARKLNGRGIDRIVPVGQALSFDSRWDGYDLLQELTRHISVIV
jgi:hypothetical protein